MNISDTWTPDTIEVPVDAKLFSALHLSHREDPVAELADPFAGHAAENGKKINALLKATLTASVSHFPLLQEGAWGALLSVTQPGINPASVVMMEKTLKPGCLAHLMSDLALDYSKEDWEGMGIARLGELTPAEILPAMLVADVFWAPESRGGSNLRTILSQVSGRPMECVFSDDPKLEDLWEVTGVTLSNLSSGQVTFSYAGAPMATLSFELTTDPREVTCRSLECEETRPLVLPGENIRSWLFDLAFSKIVEALPN